jgi:hypothetical protein
MALPEFAKTRHGAHVILYVLTASLALRAMLDGGPLAPGTPPLFLALSWLCLFKLPNDQPSALSRAVIGLMMSFGVLGMYCWFWIDASDGIPPVGILLLPVLWTFWLALIGSGPAPGWRMLGRLGAFGLLTVMVTVDASESLLPMLKPLSKGCVAVSFATDPPSEIDCAEKTAQEVYRALGEDDRKPRFTLIAANSVRGESALPLGLLIIDAAEGRFTTTASSAWPSLVIAPRSGPGGWLKVLAQASPRWPAVLTYGSPDVLSRNNYNVYLWELGRNLQKGGLTEFILMPQTAGNLVQTP